MAKAQKGEHLHPFSRCSEPEEKAKQEQLLQTPRWSCKDKAHPVLLQKYPGQLLQQLRDKMFLTSE